MQKQTKDIFKIAWVRDLIFLWAVCAVCISFAVFAAYTAAPLIKSAETVKSFANIEVRND
jgi:hypothetical protein